MLISVIEMEMMRKLSFLIFIICIIISFKNRNAETKKGSVITTKWFSSPDSTSPFSDTFSSHALFFSFDQEGIQNMGKPNQSLEYNFYRNSCPQAEQIVRSVVQQLYKVRPSVAPALLRLVFHDCFIEGCDASVLLDATEGMASEKDTPPNVSLKGFDIIDLIKSELEEACPGVVSCADTLVLAAREAVVLAGGPFYPLYTGRRDSFTSFADAATYELPSPHADLSDTLASFSSRGFDERETVSLLGAHSIGVIHCKFFQFRLYNFGGTNKPDPSLDTRFLEEMRSICNHSHISTSTSSAPAPTFTGSPSSSTAPSPCFDHLSSLLAEDPGMDMAYEGPGTDFGTLYYRSLLQGKGILYADQQLMAGEGTGIWVRAYASDSSLFRRDFALAMMKLSNLGVLRAPMGQIRLQCSKVA
ncbi:peroxidase domain-containing protein [Cephalotus follicularis]|uniref:Peroxidase n=1 Tax=Cephalotus follicularis TaxID=3775 RepID=A0A1Q3B9B0_CEPFO|nr:peroxidase domain-containing protein [Cephalotus follicularis]